MDILFEWLKEPEFWVGLGLVILIAIFLYQRVPAFVTASLDTRSVAIAKELDEAKRLREEAAALLARFRAKAGEAEKEAASIVTEAREEAARLAGGALIRHFFEHLVVYTIIGAAMKLSEHPTVRRFHEKAKDQPVAPSTLDAAWLRQLCLDCGADDAGLVEISRPVEFASVPLMSAAASSDLRRRRRR